MLVRGMWTNPAMLASVAETAETFDDENEATNVVTMRDETRLITRVWTCD